MSCSSPTKVRIRVLHVMQSLERSGMETMLLSSAEYWRARGYQLDLVATAADVGPFAPELAAAGYRVFHIPFRSRRRYLPHPRLIPEFWRLCRAGQYDIVHIHTEAASTLFAVSARAAGVAKIVFSVHNTFRFRGLLRARKFVERQMNHALGGKYGMVSDAVLESEWERFHNPGVRIYNWLNTGHFRPPSEDERVAARRRLGCPEGSFVLVTVGNCGPAKNHPELIRALLLAKKQLAVILFHIGREPEGRPEQELASDLGLTADVRFEGSRPDPRPYLWAADAFVMPSLHEGLAVAGLEAIASGAPAILANVSGLDEVAAQTCWAALCQPDAASLADAILDAARVPRATRLRHALEDSDRIRNEFSEENGVARLISGLYRIPNG